MTPLWSRCEERLCEEIYDEAYRNEVIWRLECAAGQKLETKHEMTFLRICYEERLCEKAYYEAIWRLKVVATLLRVRDKDDEGVRLIV